MTNSDKEAPTKSSMEGTSNPRDDNDSPQKEEETHAHITTPIRVPRGHPNLEIGESSNLISATTAPMPTGIETGAPLATTTNTTTPTTQVVTEDSSQRRRERAEAQGASGSGAPKRAKGELDAPKTDPACSICGKKFASWKAVFGHMRAHREREWRGAFPPPKGDWSPVKIGDVDQQRLQQQLAPTLLDLAKQTLEKIRQDSNVGVVGEGASSSSVAGEGAGASSSSSRTRDIDLNIEPRQSDPSTPPPPPPPPLPEKDETGFDLNLPPKNGDNNEDNPPL